MTSHPDFQRFSLGTGPSGLMHHNEFFGPGDNLDRFRFCGHKCIIIVNHVPCPTTSVEVIAVHVCGFANREVNDIERDLVVPSAHNAVASTCNRHFCRLQGGVVRGCKTSVCGHSSQRCIGQVANDDSTQLLQFLFRRFVSLNFVICQQLRPGHAVHLSRTANCHPTLLSKSDRLRRLSVGIHRRSSL